MPYMMNPDGSFRYSAQEKSRLGNVDLSRTGGYWVPGGVAEDGTTPLPAQWVSTGGYTTPTQTGPDGTTQVPGQYVAPMQFPDYSKDIGGGMTLGQLAEKLNQIAPGQTSGTWVVPGTNTGYGFEADPNNTGMIGSAGYQPDWSGALKAADNGGFMADYGWMLPLAIAGGGSALGAWGDVAGTAATAGSNAMDFSNLGDLWNYGDTGSSMADLQSAANQFGWSDLASPGTTAGANADIGGASWLNMLVEQAKADPLGTAAKTLQAIPGGSQLISGGLSALGGLLSGNAAQKSAKTAADAQIEAAKIAAEAAKFKPIGVTTRFGQSNFQKDAQGNVIGAGYALTPDVKAQQDALIAQSGNMLTQYQNAPAAFAPMGQSGQRAMILGNQYLATDPAAQAQKYMQEQQALLATGRERDLNQMLSGELNRGTYGLSVGGTSTGMLGANPRLEAMFNAQRQQDLGLAAQATQGGMDYAKFGAGMVGTGGDLTKGMYQGQTAAYDPYKTALGGAQTLEGLGQQSLTMGMDLGRQTSNAAAGGLLAQGMTNAAQTMQPANSYSPWGAMLSGAGNAVANYTNPSVNQQYRFDPFTGRPL